jgi:DNA-directed RNA polymerase specialized sigma24 family protein
MKDYLYRGYMRKANHRFGRRSSNAALVSLDLTKEISDGGSSKRVLENEVLFEKLYSQMDPKLQVIFYWREIEGCRWKQVGEVVGMKPHAAKVYYLRGLQRLARLVYEGSNVILISKGKVTSES